MTLIDTGPIIALINRNDPNHQRCIVATRTLPAAPLATTWPCFTEAMHLLRRAGGWPAQAELWRWQRHGRLVLYDLGDLTRRTEDLMSAYRDTPMDLADASLVALAETIGERRIFTLDRDFYVYRMANGSAFEPVPGSHQP
ncbi:PIN domain-containing protein [uncultured Thiohalocapsa sp.]|uniref:type II toxin-antitoxin system VapC family toxin n=1 Tax=uncultured Thiohalocapsa sp. TaxID=768990 RepID=UPI0025F741DA|nr:PIN domain-containing protein [uncultured Thiohalocapsa sp.]